MSLRDTRRQMKSKGGDQTDSVSKTESVFEAGLPTLTFQSRDAEVAEKTIT